MSFFAVLLAVFLLGDVWWLVSILRGTRRVGVRLAAIAWILLVLGGLGLVMGARFAGQQSDDLLPRPVLSAVFIWHLLVLPLWMIGHLVALLGSGVRRVVTRSATSEEPASENSISRREFLSATSGFAPAVLTTAAALGAESQVEHFRVRKLVVPVPNLPPALEKFTIAQVSDVHVGRFTKGAVLERIVQSANDLRPDLTVLTGDLINFALKDLPAGIDLVKGLKAQHGVYLCEGNHDLFEDAGAFRRQLLKAGVGYLRDESVVLPVGDAKLQLLGLRWTHGDPEHAELAREISKTKRDDAFPVLLAHHPHVFDHLPEFPLVLAGHTHGGQLMLNERIGFGPAIFRYWSGLYQKEGRSLIVSNGVGNWFPIRVAAPAEIVHLTLQRSV